MKPIPHPARAAALTGHRLIDTASAAALPPAAGTMSDFSDPEFEDEYGEATYGNVDEPVYGTIDEGAAPAPLGEIHMSKAAE